MFCFVWPLIKLVYLFTQTIIVSRHCNCSWQCSSRLFCVLCCRNCEHSTGYDVDVSRVTAVGNPYLHSLRSHLVGTAVRIQTASSAEPASAVHSRSMPWGSFTTCGHRSNVTLRVERLRRRADTVIYVHLMFNLNNIIFTSP